MKIDVNKMKKALPLVKDYAEKRGSIREQQFYQGNEYYDNAVSAYIRNGQLVRIDQGYSFCYAQLMVQASRNDIVLLQIQPPHEDQNVEAYWNYIEWVIHHSPWRHAYINQSMSRIKKTGIVAIYQGDLSRPYFRDACIALRMAWENYAGNGKYREVDVWWEIAQKVDPKLAYLAGKTLSTPLKYNYKLIIKKKADSGHTPLNYMLDNPTNHIDGWLRENMIKSGWSNKRVKLPIVSAINDIINNIGNNSVIVNPFSKSDPSKQYKREEFIEAMHSELPKLEAIVYA